MEQIKKDNLAKIIIKAIVKHIITNDLKSGDKLPTESELAKNFKLGRNSVREAIKALEVMGFVESKPGVGTVLTGEGIDPFLLPLIFGLVLEDAGLDHLLTLRLAIEQGATPLVVADATDAELNELMEMAKKLDKLKYSSGANLSEAEKHLLAHSETEFHQRFVQLSHNPILAKFSSLWSIFFSLVSSTGELSIAAQTHPVAEEKRVMHVPIVEALMRRDIAHASSAVRLHLRYWLERNESMPKSVLLRLFSQPSHIF